MEIKEYGNDIIVSCTNEEITDEAFINRMREVLLERPGARILLTVGETADEVIARMESVKATVDCDLSKVDIHDILAFERHVRGDVHLGHYKGHRNLTSDCMTRRIPRPGTIPKDPSKGLNGMPRKRGRGR